MKKFYIAAIVIILLTPLGLLAPGSAWGEWGLDEIKSMIGYIPEGMNRFSEVIKAILPDYSIPGFDANFFQQALGYIFSAVVGIAAIVLIFAILGRIMGKPQKKNG
ncbi:MULTISPECIES: PDGLE domain-containing protein [Thermoanaerobacter]|jgi:cobalt/nickel transport protein|uniref:Cobalt/nickel transport protein n=1 Tax=Thermoanaerobacter uzonensis DSM 18761 TaxID=1123369 RepID=A0A1M4SGC4_9THEO|nr:MULTISPECIES: PDGLE domain-containing protein [Thermoanaerobacter]KHO61371.1 PDGLE domain [Thermoanaerobacter sp. YS13]SHE31245.1 cobalt/nickel transport protein [Thermoanaerobacter uzonensis DSM 18761]